ncbi:MAG: hypothetical protein AAGA54_35160 [Myxococcota bacterium]
MSSEPQYRVALCRMALRMVRELPQRDTILAQVPAEYLEAMEGQKSLTWTRAESLDALNRAARAELGREGYIDFWTRHRDKVGETTIFGPLAEAARRIFGLDDPAGQLKWMGRAWQVSTKNLGKLVVEPHAEGFRLEHIDLPPSHRTEEVVLSTLGAARGIILGTNHTPDVELDDTNLADHGRVVIYVRWT